MYTTVPKTGPLQSIASNGRAAFVVMTSLIVGTGSSYGLDDIDKWHSYIQPRVSFPVTHDSADHKETTKIDVRSPAQHLENIRSVLNPAISELASLFDVSRQMIYKWLANESMPEPDKVASITTLSHIADSMNAAGISRGGLLLKMKIFDGDSLIDLLKAGKECSEEIDALISEAQKMDKSYLQSGFAESRAKPNENWRSAISIPSYSETS